MVGGLDDCSVLVGWDEEDEFDILVGAPVGAPVGDRMKDLPNRLGADLDPRVGRKEVPSGAAIPGRASSVARCERRPPMRPPM